MMDHTNTFHAYFEYDSAAQPPLTFVIKDSVMNPVLTRGLSEVDPSSYVAPHMNYPVISKKSRAEDLRQVAKELRKILDEKEIRAFELRSNPEEPDADRLDRSTGRVTAITAASSEVRRFILSAIAELDAEGQKNV